MNRWAIIDGWYWYLTETYGGQWSKEYKRLCKMTRYYKPSDHATGPSDEDSQEVYDRLMARFQGTA